MSAHHSHDITTWVGRSIRRVEDPALVAGLGRFTADLPAQRWVRFVRSPVAAGRIKSVKAPKGAMVLTMAELAGVKPIRPMLHKFNYIPIEHPILADGVVRFVRRGGCWVPNVLPNSSGSEESTRTTRIAPFVPLGG